MKYCSSEKLILNRLSVFLENDSGLVVHKYIAIILKVHSSRTITFYNALELDSYSQNILVAFDVMSYGRKNTYLSTLILRVRLD